MEPWMSGQFEGDIVLTPEQQERWLQNSSEHPSERNAVRDRNRLWISNEIPYKFAPGVYSSSEQAKVKRWLDEFAKVSCLKVVPWTNQTDYVRIFDDDACYSQLGRVGGEQRLSLARRGCLWRSTVIHEFLHAAGFWHEQSRIDRDKYIRVVLENIESSQRYNFDKVTSREAMDISTYDYQSVMHYESTAFSKNGEKTMIRLDGKTDELGQDRYGTFTEGDIYKLRTLYQCSDTSSTTPTTQRTTTTAPNCKNNYGSCERWADRGFCLYRYTRWMRRNCAKSCGYCNC